MCVYLYVCVWRKQRWRLTVWISSCCKSASVTDGRPLIAGLWRLGSQHRRKSLSVSLGGWEGEGWGWGRLGSHQSLSTVCVDIEAGVFKGEDWFGVGWGGLSYFDSAVVSSTTLQRACKWNLSLQFRSVLLLMPSLRNWAEELCAVLNGN